MCLYNYTSLWSKTLDYVFLVTRKFMIMNWKEKQSSLYSPTLEPMIRPKLMKQNWSSLALPVAPPPLLHFYFPFPPSPAPPLPFPLPSLHLLSLRRGYNPQCVDAGSPQCVKWYLKLSNRVPWMLVSLLAPSASTASLCHSWTDEKEAFTKGVK